MEYRKRGEECLRDVIYVDVKGRKCLPLNTKARREPIAVSHVWLMIWLPDVAAVVARF
jgi:hypothetical protein